ncbi:PP2C family protein-serine/threonine phosphatase [Streptomyces sp. CNQ-509]|uniref:PP2C family protein-serine/threonine phosphatase n=1 Tax=Streptomyces sp. CNQ-509 TaxID=444103 RepID=UPI000699D805|nr:PP2C family protein-serine/threonine phosphatase [Streptomyces sp. CNQ-509]
MHEPPNSAPPFRTVLSVLPYGVMAIVAAVDTSAGPEVGYLPLVSLGPAFAGLVGGWRRTALIGALALLLCAALGQYNGLLGDRRGYTAMFSVVAVTAAGLVAVRMRQVREAELASVRSIAETAQRVLLRPVPRAAGNLRIALSYTSALADARIGGDLYEVVTSPAGVRVIVGDVQGKGLEAVEAAAVVLGAFREAAYDEPDLQAVGKRVELALERQLPSEKFVTAIMAEIGDTPAVTLLNYGHPAPLAVNSSGDARLLDPPARALPLGLGMHGATPPQPHVHPFSPGDQILFYTDGVTEARNERGAFYPLTQCTAHLMDTDADTALAAIRQSLVDHVRGPLQDDAAMLLLRYRKDDTDAQQA